MESMNAHEQAALDGAISRWDRLERWYSETPSEESDRERKAAGEEVDRIRARDLKRET